ncbi:MAG: hypothetical protein HZB19_07465 [Chloroflexi bacterium]|nr:hypothetical protein [Chloroflexota bacterium]
MKMPIPLVVKFMKSICHVGPNLSGSRKSAPIFWPKVDDHVRDGFKWSDHTPHAEVEYDGSQNHERHGDLVQDAFEVQPAANDEGDHDGDQCQHDVQVTDDRIFQRGLFGVTDDVFREEDFKSVAEERAWDGAEQSRNHCGNRGGEKGHAFHVHAFFCTGIVFVGDVVFRVPGPECNNQQHTCEEDQRQARDVQSMECPVVTEVGEAHAKDHCQEVADRDDGIDGGFEERLHLQ